MAQKLTKSQAIESSQNSNVKRWLALLESAGIKKHKQFLVMGRKLVPELLKQLPERFTEILTTDESLPFAVPPTTKVYRLSSKLFKSIDDIGTNFPLLVGDLPTLPAANLAAGPMGLEVLCALQDPANLGALARSCEAFGVKKLVLLTEAAHPFHPRALRSSSGALLRLSLASGPSIRDLQLGNETIALDMNGENLADFKWPQHIRLLLGEEGRGLPSQKIRRLAIPMQGEIESLNATVAASIALYSYFAQHGSRA